MRPELSSHSCGERSVREVIHGIEVEDPFRWLENQDSPATRAFLRLESLALHDYLNQHKDLRSRLARRVEEHLAVVSVDLPLSDRRGGLLYLKRRSREEQKSIYTRAREQREMLLISNRMLGRDDSASLSILQVSRDGRYLAFGIRTDGEDVQEIGFFDLFEQRLLPDRLPPGFCRGLVFDRDQSGFYYAHEETSGDYRLRRTVRFHQFLRDPSRDREIFCAGEDVGLRLILRAAEDESALGYLVVSLDSIAETRFFLHRLPLNQPAQAIIHVADGSFWPSFTRYAIEASTTYGAPRGHIVRIALDQTESEQWSPFIPETDARLSRWERWTGNWVVHYTRGARWLTHLYSDSGSLIRTIEYPASGALALGQVDESCDRLFYAHRDTNGASAIFEVDLKSGEHLSWWRAESSPVRVSVRTEVHSCKSKDGTEIPITLMVPDGRKTPRPMLLEAYGAGGASVSTGCGVLESILLEQGFGCATAHVRGGGEKGLEWHLAAQKQHKQRSVDDLVAVAEWLVLNGYTTSDGLAMAGQSAGALLALCVMTQQPRLLRAVMAFGPLADLTRFHLFGVALASTCELGSPNDAGDFAALYRLSPYHRVESDVDYPAVLIISGDRDRRCDALHARKMIARLRAATRGEHTIVLDYTQTRGHKPVLPLTERIRGLADRLTFLIAELKTDALDGDPR